MRRYVGLDVHSKRSSYAVQDETGKLIGKGSIDTSPAGLSLLCQKHALEPGTPIALESGTMAFYTARILTACGMSPQVIDAAEVRAKALRPNQKSDSRDALELCEGMRRDAYRTRVHVPPTEIEQLRETLRSRRHFVNVKTMEVNAAKHELRREGLHALARGLALAAGWQKLLASLEKSPKVRAKCELHYNLWKCAQEQVIALEASLKEQRGAHQQAMDRLKTVPGVGPVVAMTAIAMLSDVRRFKSAKKVASYAGLVPSTYDSGERTQHGRITRRGSNEFRAMLCEAAQHARHEGNPFNPFFRSLMARRGYKMAIVAVAHRICRILYAMLKRGTEFDLSKLGIEEGRFEKVSVKRYRLRASTSLTA
jgi:transposase